MTDTALALNYPYKWYALIGLSLLSFAGFLDFTIVTTSLPFIQKALGANVLQLQWIVNIFAMMQCMFMIVAGQAGDLLGRKKVFYVGFILFLIAAIGSGAAPTIQWLIFFRGIQGLSAAIVFTLGIALLPQAFPPSEQTRAISIFSAFNGAGLAAGPFVGGLLIAHLGWPWIFWINIPIIVIGLLCCSFSLKPSPIPDKNIHIDSLGLIGCLAEYSDVPTYYVPSQPVVVQEYPNTRVQYDTEVVTPPVYYAATSKRHHHHHRRVPVIVEQSGASYGPPSVTTPTVQSGASYGRSVPPAQSGAIYGRNVPPSQSEASYGRSVPPVHSGAQYSSSSSPSSPIPTVTTTP